MENRQVIKQTIEVTKVVGQNVTPKSPQVGYYPAALNQQDPIAKAIWDKNIIKYQETIFRTPNTGKQWAAAVAIYKHSCAKRNTPAFGR